MSLFDDTARRLGISTTPAILGGVAETVGATIGRNILGAASRALPPGIVGTARAGVGALGKLATGDIAGAAGSVLDSGVLLQYFPHLAGAAGSLLFQMTPTPLFGGLSPIEAQRIYQQSAAETYARRNLFLLEITPFGETGATDLGEAKFNLFATEVQYSPNILAGDRAKIGSTSVDLPQSGEPVELRITTYDDQDGNLKWWFMQRCARVAHADGTVGLPAEYLLKIRILHSFIQAPAGLQYYDGGSGYYRPVNLDLSLSRQDDALEELQLSFAQFDPFVPVV
jgi:hypothetical protein